MSSAQSYNQTILLDANRLSSEEYSASNLANTDNAVFTNKVSSGLTLNVGDQVTIESAHIAQRGAGGSVIQFSGEELGEKTINTTVTENSSYIGFNLGSGLDGYSPTGYAYETSGNASQQAKVKDNEASVVFTYYKNTNGENNISLPRNFGSASMGNSTQGGDPSAGANASFWEAEDSYAKGLNTYMVTASHVFTPDYQLDQDALNACATKCLVRKVRQDNSRYTLFKRTEIVWRFDAVSSASSASYLQPVPTLPDPALGTYRRFKEKVVLGTDAGYNSPGTISTVITNELLRTENPVNIISTEGPSVINSKLYKAFPCANYELFSADTNIDFFSASIIDALPVNVSDTSTNNKESIAYLANYAFIGFKRPDFVEAGRETSAYHGNKIVGSIPLSASATAIIQTNLTWSDDVLVRLKRFLDSQAMYPELFDHATIAANDLTNYEAYNTTSASLNASFRDEARFFHVGISGDGSQLGDQAALGSDMYNVSFSGTTLDPPRTSASDQTSMPLFFYYDKNTSHLTTEDTEGDRKDNLAYGFARKWTSGGSDLIALVTEFIGGVPTPYFGEQGGNIINNTKIGYDHHFNGYGNTAIMLSSGFHPLQYYGQQEFTDGLYTRQVYCGANNALFNFDSNESRFEISNLHSSEKVGNFYNSGDPVPGAGVFAPPPSGQASVDCYKINKQLKYDSWSPSMQPYSEITLTQGKTATGNAANQKTFISMNKNLEAGKIYDAHSGVTIEDMGVTEKLWDQSIWGLLGFKYSQFNPSGDVDTIENINIKFNDNTTNTSGVTTNANILSQAGLQFSVNAFGTNMFNPMLNSVVQYYNTPQVLRTGFGSASTVTPAVVITSDNLSTTIKANKLPRKILRGYFLINSDILDTANYLQLANPLQTMAICGKYNGANDFVEYSGGGPSFTVTRKKVITDIKTQILDPEGGAAQVGDNSGVIYRVDKQITTDLNFATNLLAGAYGKPKK